VEYRKLGKSDLDISVITLGAWQYGCARYWGEVEEKNIYEVIAKSIDSGINTIDTAIGYDDSEIIVGKAIKNFREKVIIVSKGGADPLKIPQRVDLSLKRMGLDYIDLYLVHYPDVDIPIEDTIDAMARIRDEGKVRYIGVSNFSAEQLSRAISVADITCCESAYNLMWREIEDRGILDFCYKNNIGILTYSSLGQGLFTGKIRSVDDIPKREGDIRQITLFFKGEAFENSLKIVKILDELAKKYNKTPAQVAINWVTSQKGITSAIVGIENSKQLADNLGAIGWKMEKEDYDFLSSEGSRLSKMFDYASYSMFGMKWDEIKVDQMLDASL
jgi:aryl-alcohol dehydrogenase-like predicted oxidoreductase